MQGVEAGLSVTMQVGQWRSGVRRRMKSSMVPWLWEGAESRSVCKADGDERLPSTVRAQPLI